MGCPQINALHLKQYIFCMIHTAFVQYPSDGDEQYLFSNHAGLV